MRHLFRAAHFPCIHLRCVRLPRTHTLPLHAYASPRKKDEYRLYLSFYADSRIQESAAGMHVLVAHHAQRLALVLLFTQRLPLVVLLLATGERNLELRAAVFVEIQLQRHNGVAFA